MKFKLLLLIVFAGFISRAQIQGNIVDSNNKPVEFANVILCKNTGDFIVGTTTDINGNFIIKSHSKSKTTYLEISFIGYKTVKYQFNDKSDIKIVLEDDRNLLSEVKIVSKVNPIRVKGNKITANVVGTILEDETNSMELLSKVPGLKLEDGNINSYFGGKPLVYLNGRKISSMDEIKSLDVKNIKNIQLINNPGAQYDASVKAVLLITTKKKLEGLSVQLSATDKQTTYNSHNELFNINYNKGNYNIFASYTFSEDNRASEQDMHYKLVTKDTIWNNSTIFKSDRNYTKNHKYSFGVDYSVSKDQKLGFKYDGKSNTFLADMNNLTNVLANDKQYENIKGLSIGKDNSYFNHANIYYSNKLNVFTYEMYGDYVNSNTKRKQNVDELKNNKDRSSTNSVNESDYEIYALNQSLKYNIDENNNLLFGFECGFVNGDNSLAYNNTVVNPSKSETFERKLSAFVDYNLSLGTFSLQAGLRYENTMAKYNDKLDSKNNIKNTYINFFPSLNLSYTKNNITNTLSYRSGIRKPSFDMMTSYSFYVNKYLYQIGNSNLKSQISHDVQYSFIYKFILFQLGYSYYDDYIGMTFQNKDANSPVIVSTKKNYNKSERLTFMLNLNYKFGFYEPNITFSGIKNMTDIIVDNKTISNDKPMYYVDFNNYIKLPKGVLLNINYQYNSGGSFDFFETGETNIVNASIKKSFFGNRLAVSISAKDIFRDNTTHMYGQVRNLTMNNVNDFDLNSYSISLIWRFNNYKSSYRGKSAAGSEINRL